MKDKVEKLPIVNRVSICREIWIPAEELLEKLNLNIQKESKIDIEEVNDYATNPTTLLGIKVKVETLVAQKNEIGEKKC